MLSLSSQGIAALSRELDFCALRHQIYSANVANADVNGYHRLEVQHYPDLGIADPITHAGTAGQVMTTSETVKLDQEMAKLAGNALHYETLLTAYEKTAGILNMAIKEGRGG